MPRPRKDYIGYKKGRLTVLKDGPDKQYTNRAGRTFVCKCDCGEEITIISNNLLQGRQLSCGCLRSEKVSKRSTTHGFSTNPEWDLYRMMIARCNDKTNKHYQHYGARNIKVCPEWQNSFDQFLKDMGPRPSKDYSIERVNVNGDYEPSNCIWLLKNKQQRNQTTTKLNPDIAKLIRKKYSEGMSIKNISQLVNQSYGNVYNVCKNNTWKNI